MSASVLYLVIAVALIGTELLIMQFSVFWFLFFGLGALVTSLLCWMMPELSWFASATSFLIASLAISGVLYPFLKKWQDQPSPIAGNDAIGQSATVVKAISTGKVGKVSWSGTDWPAELADNEEPFAEGDTVVIRKLEGIRLLVGR